MKLHRYVDHQRLHIVTKDVISLSMSVLLLFRHYISHKITFGASSSGGVLRSACGAFISPYCRKVSTQLAHNVGPSQPTSDRPLRWHFPGRPLVARRCVLFGLVIFLLFQQKHTIWMFKRTVLMRGSF